MHFFGMCVSYCKLRHPTMNLFIGFPFTKGHKQSLKLHFLCCNLESLYVRVLSEGKCVTVPCGVKLSGWKDSYMSSLYIRAATLVY